MLVVAVKNFNTNIAPMPLGRNTHLELKNGEEEGWNVEG